MVEDFDSLAELNKKTIWAGEWGEKSSRIRTGYLEARGQLIDQGFYGE